LVGCDKEDKLYGTWHLQVVKMNGAPLNDSLQFNVIPFNTYYTFFYANVLNIKTYSLGKTIESPTGKYYLKKNSTLDMQYSLLYETYNITAKIKKLNRNELILEYEDKGNNYYLKLYSR